MKSAQKWLITAAVMLLTVPAQAQVFDALKLEMEKACPAIWEDLGISINSVSIPADVWLGNQSDISAFTVQYIQNYSVTQAEAKSGRGNNICSGRCMWFISYRAYRHHNG